MACRPISFHDFIILDSGNGSLETIFPKNYAIETEWNVPIYCLLWIKREKLCRTFTSLRVYDCGVVHNVHLLKLFLVEKVLKNM